jgi:predicted outer membrane repeat protein
MLPSHPDGDDSHYYGGAIAAFSNKNIYLENCSIFNNTAEYGGAIYASGGNLTILNSAFYNNTASYFAGAVLADTRIRITIANSRFYYNRALDDAGGAMYILNADLKADNLTVSDCSATFGGAITALTSNLNLSSSVFKDNHARYDGGALYQIYGSLNLNSSEFILNTAETGAGLFINDVNVLNVSSNEFINNTASQYASAIYSLLEKGFDYRMIQIS